MLEKLRPKTIAGIRSLGKDLAKQNNIQLSKALDDAARQAGFSNFTHASRSMSHTSTVGTNLPIGELSYPIYLSAYWRDNKTYERGLEVVKIPELGKWLNQSTSNILSSHGITETFYPKELDHLQVKRSYSGKNEARFFLGKFARKLQFMAATGLKPSTGHSRAFPQGSSENRIPGQDHACYWYHPETKTYVISDEPYIDEANRYQQERQLWSETHGFAIERPHWKGFHNPESETGTQLFLIADSRKSLNLNDLSSALSKLPALHLENWPEPTRNWEVGFTGQKPKPLPTKIPGRKASLPTTNMHPLRKLLVEAINHLLAANAIPKKMSLHQDLKGHCEATIFGERSIIIWRSTGFDEVTISVWWKYDHSKHPQANLDGPYRETFNSEQPLANQSAFKKFVGAVCSGWLTLSDTPYLQGNQKKGIFKAYLRQDQKDYLVQLQNPTSKGFAESGKIL